MNDWNEMDAFLTRHQNNYLNPWGVMFNSPKPGNMFINAPWPLYIGDADLSLVFICDKWPELYSKLHIEGISQIYDVKPSVLLDLFYQEAAFALCMIDAKDGYYYKICEGELLAAYNEDQYAHVAKSILETPEDFINYSKTFSIAIKEHRKGKRKRKRTQPANPEVKQG